MREVSLFVEDFGHEEFLKALVNRFAREYGLKIKINNYSVRGGYGKVINELKEFIRDLNNQRVNLPDLLIIATDANCKGIANRRREIKQVVEEIKELVVCAIPDPHIERWILLDSAAFKNVFTKGCQAPDCKCDRYRYKNILLKAIRDAGITPPLGGMEYAEDIVNAMDLERMKRVDDLGALLQDLHAKFKVWKQI